MKLILSLVFAIALTSFQSYNLSEVRKMYVAASDSKANANKFFETMEKYENTNETLLAYKGVSIAIKAKHAQNIKEKKEFFIKGVTILEAAIKSNPNNIELRLIRLSIQENTPKIMKYKQNIEEDKKQLLLLFDKQSSDLKEYIRNYVNQSKMFTAFEKQQFNK